MFITIDGPDGTGKTTFAKALVKHLSKTQPCVFTSEPTDTPLGMEIRSLLRIGASPAHMTELFVKDRAAHINEYILPKINAGISVVCDRYKYSTICYQHLQGEPLEKLLALNQDFLSPDLSVILTVKNVEILCKRIDTRGKPLDFFETASTLTHAIEIYNNMKTYFPNENFLYLDAQQSTEDLLKSFNDNKNQGVFICGY